MTSGSRLLDSAQREVDIATTRALRRRQALPLVRREIRSLDPNVGVFDAMPLTEFIGASLFAQKVAALLLAVLGAVALVLAAVGLYSVMAYSSRKHRPPETR